jgi:hypothetical protein
MTKNKSFISQHTTHSREVYSVITVLERERERVRERDLSLQERERESERGGVWKEQQEKYRIEREEMRWPAIVGNEIVYTYKQAGSIQYQDVLGKHNNFYNYIFILFLIYRWNDKAIIINSHT